MCITGHRLDTLNQPTNDEFIIIPFKPTSPHKSPILMSYFTTHQAVGAQGFCHRMSYLELAMLILILKYLTCILSISLLMLLP